MRKGVITSSSETRSTRLWKEIMKFWKKGALPTKIPEIWWKGPSLLQVKENYHHSN